MGKRREQELANQNEDIGRFVNKVYAALYHNVPWLAVSAVSLYLPGIVLWAVFALRCKADTFIFLTTIAPVAPETVDGVSNLVNTTLIALSTTATFIFLLALLLAFARCVQKAGTAPNASIPFLRNSPSNFYLYRVFNLGYNFIVFFVNMFIIFLMMGAFLWLVVAYGANLSIKGGVLDAAQNGFRPELQFDKAKQNYTTVVSAYENQLKRTPPCVRNSTWLKQLNGSITSILKPASSNSSDMAQPLLCPQSCLNLGSWATLFKLKSGCMCEQEKLFLLQAYSMAIATDAGVALGGLILIYLGSCCMHTYLISEHTHAGYDYKRAKRQAARRQQQANINSSNNNTASGNDFTTLSGDGPDSGGGGSAGMPGKGVGAVVGAHHIVAMNGSGIPDDGGPDVGGATPFNPHGPSKHNHQHSNSSSSVYDSFARAGAEQQVSRVDEAGAELEPTSRHNSMSIAGSAAAAASGVPGSTQAVGLLPGESDTTVFATDPMPAQVQQSWREVQQQRLQQQQHRRVSSGGGSSSPSSSVGRQLRRLPSPTTSGLDPAAAAAAAAGGLMAARLSQDNQQGWRGAGSRLSDVQQQQQQQHVAGHDLLPALSPPAMHNAAGWPQHVRSESRSSSSSIRDLLSGAVPLDNLTHMPHRIGLSPTSSGNAAAAMAAAAAAAAAGTAAAAAGFMEPLHEVPPASPNAERLSGVGTSGAAGTPAANDMGARSVAHQRSHSQQSDNCSSSSSSSYNTVVCHSPRSSDPDGSIGSSSLGLQTAAAASAVLSGTGSVSGKGATLQQQQQRSKQHHPAQTVATTTPGVQANSVDPVNVSTPSSLQVSSDTEPVAALAVDGEEVLSGSRTGSWSKRQAHRRLPALDFTKAAPALWLAQESEQPAAVQSAAVQPDQSPQLQLQQEAESHGARLSSSSSAAVGSGAAAAAADCVPVRRQIMPSSGHLNTDLQQQPAVSWQHHHQQQQQQVNNSNKEALPPTLQVGPQRALAGGQGQQGAPPDTGTAQAGAQPQEQQQRKQPPPFAQLLLPPPEQQELLRKQQQYQLQLLLQQSQDAQQQHTWQQPHQQLPLHKQLATQSPEPAGSSVRTGTLSAMKHLQQHHQHSFSTPDTSAFGGAARAEGIAFERSHSGMNRAVSSGHVTDMAIPQQQAAGLHGSYSSSLGAARFAASTPTLWEDDSSPGEDPHSSSSRGGPLLPFGAVPAGGGAFERSQSVADGSVGSSMYNTPLGTPAVSPPHQWTGRNTPNLGSHMPSTGNSSSWGSLPQAAQSSSLTASSSYRGSANHPGFAAGVNSLLQRAASPAGSAIGPLGGEGPHGSSSSSMAALPHPVYGAVRPGTSTSVGQELALQAIPPIPEVPVASPGEVADTNMDGSTPTGQPQQQPDVVMESPLERRRSGYRSSMRKGLMAYDQYKHRQRYQDTLTQPLDPGSDSLSRRYRSRMPPL